LLRRFGSLKKSSGTNQTTNQVGSSGQIRTTITLKAPGHWNCHNCIRAGITVKSRCIIATMEPNQCIGLVGSDKWRENSKLDCGVTAWRQQTLAVAVAEAYVMEQDPRKRYSETATINRYW